jgi:putative ABC transport system permease protein
MNDLRFASRQLLKSPGFAAVAVLTLALGIGATTAIFSVINAVVLRPLPYPRSDRLVWLSERGSDWTGGPLSYPNYVDWRSGQDVFEHFGIYNFNNFTLTGSGEPAQLAGARVSAETLAALKVAPQVGRTLTLADDTAGAPSVVLISHALWQGRFAADRAVVGRPITLDGALYEVVGVMPAGFAFPNAVDLWVPMAPAAADASWQDRGNHPSLYGLARLKPGITLEQARAALDAVAVRLEQEYPGTNKNRRVHAQRLLDNQVGDTPDALWTLLGAVALVLLIACANVANLLLARSATRQKELAVRVALGAGRWRIVRQLLTESVLLAAVGATAGLLLAQWGLGLILAIGRDSIPRADEVGLDARVLLFCAAVAVLTCILFGLAPALQASLANAQGALKDAARGITAGRARLRQALTVAEVALTLVLLIGAGLLLRSFYLLKQVNPGYSYERVLSFRTSLPEQKYPAAADHVRFYDDLLERVRALPGVQSASIASQLPLDNNVWDTSFLIDGRPAPPPHERPSMEVHLVGPDYFETMNIPLLQGRAFTQHDNRQHLTATGREDDWAAGLNVIVIDEEFGRRHFPGQDPLGQRVRLTWGPDTVMTVVGVVGRVRAEKLSDAGGKVQAYLPSLQLPSRGMAVVVKTTNEPSALVPAVRQQVATIDPEQPIFDVHTLAEMREGSLAPGRLSLMLLAAFAAVALVLAVVGLYGVLAYTVTQRRREIGVRMALGARRAQVLALVVREGMGLAAAGVGIGVLCSLAATRLLRAFLYEVTPFDPLTFAAVIAMLGIVALLASLVPAHRAATVEPLTALRHE